MAQKTRSAGEWPLVGRDEELALLRQFRATGQGTSAFLSGIAGVGKSRLGREALDEAAGEGWATLAIRGSAGYSGIPLGPFRTVLGLAGSSDLTELTESVMRYLRTMRSASGLLLLADDCQDLDDVSAALLHQLVAARLVVALVTTRTGFADARGGDRHLEGRARGADRAAQPLAARDDRSADEGSRRQRAGQQRQPDLERDGGEPALPA